MSDEKPKRNLTGMENELYNDNKIWRRSIHLVLMNGTGMVVTKVHVVARYTLLVTVEGIDKPLLIQKHAIAYAEVDVPKKGSQEPL